MLCVSRFPLASPYDFRFRAIARRLRRGARRVRTVQRMGLSFLGRGLFRLVILRRGLFRVEPVHAVGLSPSLRWKADKTSRPGARSNTA